MLLGCEAKQGGGNDNSTDSTTEVFWPWVDASPTLPKPTEPVVETVPTLPSTEPTVPEPTIYTASIGAVGDLLMHESIFSKAALQADGTYNFDSIFKYIDDYISSLDYAVANLETTLCGTENGYGYSGYPRFNCPDEIVDGAKKAGFDMLLTANNHSYDTGIMGYKRTIDVIRSKGLSSLGTYASPDEIKWVIQDVNGIKLGMLCYTYAYSVTADGRPSLNGNSPIAEAGLCNYFYFKNLDLFYEEVNGYLSEMEEAGADATIMFIHWGTEYKTSANNEQRKIAQKLCDIGIDLIVGAHPHVIQPIELIESSVDPNHKTVCIYSTGNAISNQRLGNISYVKTAHTEDGILFSVTFEKVDDGEAYVSDVDVLPTWVYKHRNNGKTEFNIIPLDWNRIDEWKEIFGLNDSTFQKAIASYERTMDIVEDGLTEVEEWIAEQYAVG
jgi:poly-gamma-glutamate synthesis protein (capsule biosynthesis protein)